MFSKSVMPNKYILLVCLILFSFAAISQTSDARFEHLPPEKGVSLNRTQAIIQDSKGFIWFGTAFGLIKYDGYNYKTYSSGNVDSLSLSHNYINCLLEARDGSLWIGTRGGGLNRFDPESETFIHFINDPSDSTSLSNNYVKAIEQDHLGNLWIGTEKGLNFLSHEYPEQQSQASFKQYHSDLWDITSLSYPVINTVFEDANHTLWVGTNNGLNEFIPQSQSFNRYFAFDSSATFSLSDNIYSFTDSLISRKRTLSALLEIGDFQNCSDTFILRKQTDVLVIGLGEGYGFFIGKTLEQMSDKGWLEKAGTKKIVWQMTYNSTFYAGGAQKNRIQAELLTLSPGTYRLRYKSDDSHSVKNWNNHPPKRQDFWGVQVLRINRKEKEELRRLLSLRYNFHPNSLSSNTITSIVQGDNSSTLWVGTAWGGVNKFDLHTKKFRHYKKEADNVNSLPGNQVNAIIRDGANSYWIGTDNGLSLFNCSTESFINYRHNSFDPNSISANNILSVFKDRSGIIWLACNWGGVDKLNMNKSRFAQLNLSEITGEQKAVNNVLAVRGDSRGALWIGTAGAGLIKYNPELKTYRKFTSDKKDPQGLSYNYVKAIIEADSNHLWVGTYGGGLNKVNINSGRCSHYFYDNNDPRSLSDERILSLLQDSKGRLWVGTEMGGLNLLEPGQSGFTRFKHIYKDSTTISSNTIYSLYEDRLGRIWVGTLSGLNLFIEGSKTFIHYKYLRNNYKTSAYDRIYIIQGSKQDKDSSLWIGTSNGLLRFYPQKGLFENFSRFTELSNNSICGIEEVDQGFLWISTIKGLLKFNPRMSEIKSYDYSNGLQSNIFSIQAHCRLKNGEIVFGGVNGLNIFHPRKIKLNNFIPPVYITGFKVFDKTKRLIYNNQGEARIALKYLDNFFTIEFASLDYTNPEGNQYLYRLKGINKDWVHLTKGHSASYTNVDPGEFVFELKGSNSNGLWNKDKSRLLITIEPPFWLTAWFKIFVLLLLLSLITWIILYIRSKEKRRTALNKQIAELKLQALRARMDPHFIFNTINAIQYLISENDQDAAFFYLSSFARLLRLILHHSEEAAIPLEEELELLRLYLEMQKLRFENKFRYSIEVDPEIDVAKIKVPTMIIQPYVENAVEHGISQHDHKGTITISIEKDTDSLICKIVDDGIGINKALKMRKKISREHKSTAMQLTNERLRIINQDRKRDIGVSVIDLNDLGLPSGGTQVTIHIPV